jgi:catechol 2,3-dioxygenase-like lactoylglutathione lyase family enzyme
MSADPHTLFAAYDRGVISRRQLFQALGIAVAPVAVAATFGRAPVFAQGQCGGARAGTPECDTTPAKAPFASTGWKTVQLDFFSCQVADYPKEAAYYQALMNWKVRSDDGKQAMLDIGDWGGLRLYGGYVAPPPPPTPPPSAAPAGAGAGRGGQGGGPRAPRNANFDNMSWAIDKWDAKKVEADLKSRGLSPVADNHGEFQSFHVKDPDGFDLQISNGKIGRKGAAGGKTSAPAPFASTAWKTVWLDHISFEVTNYKETAAFYNALLGWKLGTDEGSQNTCDIGDVGGIIIRRGGRGPAAPGAPRRASMGHISFGIADFDPDKVKEELTKRGLNAREDTGGRGDIHTAPYKSYHTTTPNGYDLQISATTRATRNDG